jgi:hypothetical protein
MDCVMVYERAVSWEKTDSSIGRGLAVDSRAGIYHIGQWAGFL